jgi:hypothetical protein
MLFKTTYIRFGDGDIPHQCVVDADGKPVVFMYHTNYPQKPGKRVSEFPPDVDVDDPDVVLSFKTIRDLDRFIGYLKQLRKAAVEEQKNDSSTDESSGL